MILASKCSNTLAAMASISFKWYVNSIVFKIGQRSNWYKIKKNNSDNLKKSVFRRLIMPFKDFYQHYGVEL